MTVYSQRTVTVKKPLETASVVLALATPLPMGSGVGLGNTTSHGNWAELDGEVGVVPPFAGADGLLSNVGVDLAGELLVVKTEREAVGDDVIQHVRGGDSGQVVMVADALRETGTQAIGGALDQGRTTGQRHQCGRQDR